MSKWYNESGKPLSAISWLQDHHNAKIDERRQFVKHLLKSSPKTIVDLGCGPGLWLELFNEQAPSDCCLVGIDSDDNSLIELEKKTSKWNRETKLIRCDIEKETNLIPNSDLILGFNIFPYLKSPTNFINHLQTLISPKGKVIIRQYDGGTLRFGPLDEKTRLKVNGSLFSSIGASQEFYHYDLDRIHKIISSSSFSIKHIEFELFQRTYPFSKSFLKYYNNTIEWTLNYLSEESRTILENWNKNNSKTYFFEVDLVAELS